jgi:hypothetical protein
MEINPRVMFERMFGGGNTAEERLARMNTIGAFSISWSATSKTSSPGWAPATAAG